MTDNYWTTGADDDQSRCTITQRTQPAVLLHGEFITIAGNYKRRTLWQWLRNHPRQLKLYRVQNNTCQVEK